jgi:hypothetical protein
MTKFPKRITLDITDKDIRLGEPEDCRRCAAARAAKRLRLAKVVSVHAEGVCFSDESNTTLAVYKMSPRLARFVRRFDEGLPVQSQRVVLTKAWEVRP